jgi:hypothetical protein
MPGRAESHAAVPRQPSVWVSQGLSVGMSLALRVHGWRDFYNERVLMALAVPPDSIRILPRPRMRREVQKSPESRAGGIHSVIIVTSAPHSPRPCHLEPACRRFAPDCRRPPGNSFDAAHWWRSTGDALDVVREWLGLANAWAGFPLQPGPK